MLGPPVCIPCMRIMDGYERPKGHRYWKCDVCGVDCIDNDNCSSLFLLSKKDIEMACREMAPDYLKTVNKLLGY